MAVTVEGKEKVSKKATVASKKTKKKKTATKHQLEENKVDEEPKVVTLNLNGHTYNGILRTDALGKRILDVPSATYTWKEGTKYEGPFIASEIEGSGKYIWPDGSTYEGQVSKGKRHGQGVYLHADGSTKYEGEWFEGRRHGVGVLSYGVKGEAYYSGQWQDGCKHGEGRQVWPSKNTYEGQWRQGRMSGTGTMIWRDTGMLEVYTGEWDNDVPQGAGRHVWHAPDVTRPEMGGKEMPSQQTNNSYEGQWVGGVRHGTGQFSYASGSTYQGQWDRNMKHGEGRYTYEDGSAYNSLFVGDNMADPRASKYQSSSLRGALNIGGEDNPVRRCIDITDLTAFFLPDDRGERDPEDFSAYDQNDEVMREIFNILLRNMGHLKKIYSQLRKSLVRPNEDPWILSMHQYWIMAREAGLLSPQFSLARLDRHILCGIRHNTEVCPHDQGELRPLTPRPAVIETSKTSANVRRSRSASKASHLPDLESQPVNEAEGDEEEEEVDDYEEIDDLPSEPSDDEEMDDGRRLSRSRGSRSTNMSNGDYEEVKSHMSRHYSQSDGGFAIMTEYNRFWRRESMKDQKNLEGYTVSDVHKADGKLMFRHFLESIVRLAHSSYSNLKGIEHMLGSLLKKHVLPLVDANTTSLETLRIFEYLTDANIQEVLGHFHSPLWSIFKHSATGEGQYDRPLWAVPLDEDEGSAAAKKNEKNQRRLKRHFAGMQRRVHVQARMDVTIRIKDALHVLYRAGFLSSKDSRIENIEPTASVFPDRAPRPETAETQNTAPIEELQGLKEAMGGLGGLLGAGGDGPGDASHESPQPEEKTSPVERESPDEEQSRPVTQDAGSASSAVGTEAKVDAEEAADQSMKVEEYLKQDFSVSFLRVLEILTEVQQPELSSCICWSLPQEPSDEHVALLDFLETELNFAEFQRLLLRLSELPNAYEQPLPQHICLNRFLEDVFLPSLDEPYVAPSGKSADQPPEAPTDDAAREDPDAGEREVEAQADQEVIAEETAEEAAPLPETSLTFWHGFAEEEELELALVVTPRAWPEDYETEVDEW
mmetsp:Transcript_755/g.1371  ORF Transcript_755/g.1371 Transcript_755/m.1371 type:complete len:1046 (-) Transcript_755:81-3218(-)